MAYKRWGYIIVLILTNTVITSRHFVTMEDITNKRGKYKSYTIAEKQTIVDETKTTKLCKVAAMYNVSESCIRRWCKEDLSAPRHKSSGKLLGSGRKLSYPPQLDDDIKSWVLERRSHNLHVSTLSIQRYAKQLIRPHNPTFIASYGWLQKFMGRAGLCIRTKTSVSQKLPDSYFEVVTSFRDFMARNRQRVDPEFILNMDETPVYFDNVPNTTVDEIGVKTVRMQTTGGDKRRCTVVLGISHTGDFLKTMIIFKGKRQLKLTHPDSVVVRVQEKAWMNEALMLEWVDICLRAYTDRRPSILVLDSFRAHITDDVTGAMKKHSVVPAVIPGGCTSLLQPLDVSINKPMKDHAKQLWSDYMDTINATTPTKTASKQQMVDWVVEAINNINKEMVIKSFKVTGLTTKLDGSEDHMINRNIMVNSKQ